MTYLLFQMALYMLATLLLGFVLGWYIWGNLFEDGNVLGKLGFASGGASDGSGESDKLAKLREENSRLQEELSRMNASRAGLENDLDSCQTARSALQAQLSQLQTGSAVKKSAPETSSVVSLVGTKPTGLSGPRAGKADDLKQIKGIGPKLEKMLHGMGFYHFDQIAGWGQSELAWVDENLEGFKGRASRDEWIKQARKLG